MRFRVFPLLAVVRSVRHQNIVPVALAAALALPVSVAAQAQPVQAQASGQVVRVDVAAGKIAIRHGAISKLDLPAMTLIYHTDPALLAGVSAGDSVDFTAQRAGGQYQITALRKQ